MPTAMTKQRVILQHFLPCCVPYFRENKAASAYKKRENIRPILPVGLIKTYTVNPVGETC